MDKKQICTNCGAKNENNAKFCISCGVKIEYVESKQDTAKKNKKAPIAIAIIAGCVVLIAGGIFGIIYLVKANNPVNLVIDKIKTGNFEDAKEIYEDDIDEDEEKILELIDELETYLAETKTTFYNEESTYEEVKDTIELVEYFNMVDLEDEVADLKEYIEIINDSRTAYKTAEAYMESQNYLKAIDNYSKVNVEDSNYENAKTKKQEAITIYKNNEMTKAEKAAESGDYAEAIAILNEVEKYLKNDADILTKKDIYTTAMESEIEKTAITKSERLVEAGDYEGAIAVLKEAAKNVSDDTKLIALVDEYTNTMEINIIETAISTATEYKDNKDYINALDTLESVLSYNNESVNNLYTTVYDEFYTSVLAEAEEVFNTSGHTAAVNKLNEYNSYFGEKDDFIEKKEYYAGLAPVNLTEMKTFDESKDWEGPVFSASDHLGNSFSNCYVQGPYTSYGSRYEYVEYYVNGKYTSISGTIAASINQDVDHIGKVEIYADDELVYSSQNVTAKTDPFDFKVDITGKKYIMIKVWTVRTGDTWGDHAFVIIANAKLNKY